MTVGLDYRLNRLSLRPELVFADARNDVFPGETPTPGYGLFNLTTTYTIPRESASHQLALNFFNAGNRLYRNHANLLKSRVPEIGRGIRFSYAVEFMRSAPSPVLLSNEPPGETVQRATPSP